jgi:DNA end-binding protein Ku
VDRQTAPFELADMEDRYEARLRKVLAAKLKGEGIAPAPPETPRRDNVVDLMAALKQSLARTASGARVTSRASAKASPSTSPASGRGGAEAGRKLPSTVRHMIWCGT